METIVLKMQHQNKKCAVDRTIEISQSNSRVNRPQKNQTKHKPKNQLAKPEEPMGEKKLAEPQGLRGKGEKPNVCTIRVSEREE